MRLDAAFARLSRRTSSGRYLPEVDGLRFVAIALVIVSHTYGVMALFSRGGAMVLPFGDVHVAAPSGALFETLIHQGGKAVLLFFALSGFILALPFVSARAGQGEPVRVRRYYMRRLTRLEPPYLLVITLFLLVGVVVSDAGATGLLGHYVAGLVYAHGPLFGFNNPIDSVTWSLEVEVQFYALVPLIALLLTSERRVLRRVSIIAGCVVCAWFQFHTLGREPLGHALVASYLSYFLIGWLFADIYVHDWGQRPSKGRIWDLVSLVGWPGLLLGAESLPSFRIIVLPYLILLLFFAAFRGPITSRILANRWLTTIGGMCYSLYLLHYPILLLTARAMRDALVPWPVEVVVLTGAVVASGIAFFVLVERPCMDQGWPGKVRDALTRRLGGRASPGIELVHEDILVLPDALR